MAQWAGGPPHRASLHIAGEMLPSAAEVAAAQTTEDQRAMDKLLAPIALYPDALWRRC